MEPLMQIEDMLASLQSRVNEQSNETCEERSQAIELHERSAALEAALRDSQSTVAMLSMQLMATGSEAGPKSPVSLDVDGSTRCDTSSDGSMDATSSVVAEQLRTLLKERQQIMMEEHRRYTEALGKLVQDCSQEHREQFSQLVEQLQQRTAAAAAAAVRDTEQQISRVQEMLGSHLAQLALRQERMEQTLRAQEQQLRLLTPTTQHRQLLQSTPGSSRLGQVSERSQASSVASRKLSGFESPLDSMNHVQRMASTPSVSNSSPPSAWTTGTGQGVQRTLSNSSREVPTRRLSASASASQSSSGVHVLCRTATGTFARRSSVAGSPVLPPRDTSILLHSSPVATTRDIQGSGRASARAQQPGPAARGRGASPVGSPLFTSRSTAGDLTSAYPASMGSGSRRQTDSRQTLQGSRPSLFVISSASRGRGASPVHIPRHVTLHGSPSTFRDQIPYVVTWSLSSGVDFRHSPDIGSKIAPNVDFAPAGSTVVATEVKGDWLRTVDNKWLPIRLPSHGVLLEPAQGVHRRSVV